MAKTFARMTYMMSKSNLKIQADHTNHTVKILTKAGLIVRDPQSKQLAMLALILAIWENNPNRIQ